MRTLRNPGAGLFPGPVRTTAPAAFDMRADEARWSLAKGKPPSVKGVVAHSSYSFGERLAASQG